MIWVIIISIGIFTFVERVSFIALAGRYQLPSSVRHALKYVPMAAMAAIALPSLLYQSGEFVSPINPRFVAAALAAWVAWRTHNAILTLVSGMVALWLLQSLVS